MTRELSGWEHGSAAQLCIARGHECGSPCPTCKADVVRLVDGPAVPRVSDADLLAWILRHATMAVDEDGEHLCIWLNFTPENEEEQAFLRVCMPSGDEGELTAEDAPYLSAVQLALLNGERVPPEQRGNDISGTVLDNATLRAAIDAASRSPETGDNP